MGDESPTEVVSAAASVDDQAATDQQANSANAGVAEVPPTLGGARSEPAHSDVAFTLTTKPDDNKRRERAPMAAEPLDEAGQEDDIEVNALLENGRQRAPSEA